MLVREEVQALDKSVVLDTLQDTLQVEFFQSGYVSSLLVLTLGDCGTVAGNPVIL